MADNEIIRSLERMREEDPDGFSSDVLNYINNLKAEIQQLQLSTMVCEQRELIIENAKLITLNWGNPLVVAIKSEAIREFAKELMQNLDGEIEDYGNAGHSLDVYAWLNYYLRSKGAI